MIGAESILIDQWMTDTLTGAPAVTSIVNDRIFDRFMASGQDMWPVIIWQSQSPPRDITTANGARFIVEALYLVKAVAQVESYTKLAPLVSAIDVALTGPTDGGVCAVLPTGVILTCIRDSAFESVEVSDGKQYRHLGGLYRIQAHATQ